MPDNRIQGTRRTAWLDDVRKSHSCEETRDLFQRLYSDDAIQAINMLNDDRLSFPTLHILRPEISKLSLWGSLSDRNRKALEVEKDLLARRHPGRGMTDDELRAILKWMLRTGSDDVGLGEEYDAIMDLAALVLIKEYREADIVPVLVDIIFRRHRRGLNTHDAEWALFESGNPECIAMIARHLLSKDARDVSMARRLLRFIPCPEQDDAAAQYQWVMQWLGRNRRYLAYTGESNQKCSTPRPFQVVLERKYLQRALDAGELLPEEEAAVAAFSQLPPEDKELLSEYSHYLHATGGAQWRWWMQNSLEEQIAAARRWQGVRYV
jgi:hypothetical protein